MKESDLRILKKIASEIEYLEHLLDGVSMESFLENETVERAASMTTINVGELAKRLSDEFYADHPKSELRYAAKTRDVYAHGYFSLSFATVYKTAKEDYPRLGEWVRSLVYEQEVLRMQEEGGREPAEGCYVSSIDEAMRATEAHISEESKDSQK